jgi:hypothetical protein
MSGEPNRRLADMAKSLKIPLADAGIRAIFELQGASSQRGKMPGSLRPLAKRSHTLRLRGRARYRARRAVLTDDSRAWSANFACISND